MKAYSFQRGIKRRLLLIAPEQMDKLLSSSKAGKVVGFPAYFDMNKRLWPQPADGIEVKFESKAA